MDVGGRGDGAGAGQLGEEVALYEVARRRDELGDLAGALGVLREHRARFPSGALRTEVDLSIAEILPRLGRYREALDETARLLAAEPRDTRAAELDLLREHVLREGLRDFAGAERAYAAASEQAAMGRAGERAVDAALFWRGVCLESLGRAGEARAAYERYLARPRAGGSREAAEARRRLAAIPLP